MLIDCSQQHPNQNYFLLIQLIVPRPIAWVLSESSNGAYNLAPFSFFNAVASDPPVIMLSVGWKDDSTEKDTLVNIRERKDFVVHIPSVAQINDVVDSSATYDHEISEVDLLGLSLENIEGQRLSKLKGSKVALFCHNYSTQQIGHEKQGLILGQINHIWLSEDIATMNQGHLAIDPKALDPLARLGGTNYAGLGEIFSMKRPQ